jgi:hypothetical protein
MKCADSPGAMREGILFYLLFYCTKVEVAADGGLHNIRLKPLAWLDQNILCACSGTNVLG